MPNENGGLYLQFENQSLCVKLRAVDPEKGERRRARGRVLAARRARRRRRIRSDDEQTRQRVDGIGNVEETIVMGIRGISAGRDGTRCWDLH